MRSDADDDYVLMKQSDDVRSQTFEARLCRYYTHSRYDCDGRYTTELKVNSTPSPITRNYT